MVNPEVSRRLAQAAQDPQLARDREWRLAAGRAAETAASWEDLPERVRLLAEAALARREVRRRQRR
jgi:hypothetical protein